MLFNNFAFLPGLAFFRRLFLKRCMATLRLPTFLLPWQKLLYGFRSTWPVRQ